MYVLKQKKVEKEIDFYLDEEEGMIQILKLNDSIFNCIFMYSDKIIIK